MNKPKITFGKIQLNVKKDESTDVNKAAQNEDAESTSGYCFFSILPFLFVFFYFTIIFCNKCYCF